MRGRSMSKLLAGLGVSSLGLVFMMVEICDISVWSFEPVISNHLVYSRAPFTRVRGTNGIWTSCLL